MSLSLVGRAGGVRAPLGHFFIPLYYIRMKGQNGPYCTALSAPKAQVAGLARARKGTSGGS